MTHDDKALVERLAAEADNFKVAREVDMRAIFYRAADRIEALIAENERLRFVGKLLCNFAGHDDDCRSHKLMGCNCGYTDAWKKWRAALEGGV